MASENTRDSPDDTSEGRGSSIPVDFHTTEQTGLEDEYTGPMDLEVAHTDLPSSADNTCVASQMDQCVTSTLIVILLLMQLRKGPELLLRRDQPADLPMKMISSTCK